MKNDVSAKVPGVEEPKIEKEKISKEGIPLVGRNERTRVDDYLYCCPNNLEINVCCFLMDNIGYPKLEFGLSVMPF